MEKRIINTSNAPAPIGPYSQAVMINGTLYCSGQVALNVASGDMIQESIEAETTQVMANIQALLTAAGLGFSNVVKTTIFLSDMGHFAKVNETYSKYFTGDFPARETVAVKELPRKANVEISVTAVV